MSLSNLKYLIIPLCIAGLCALSLNSEKINYSQFYNQNKGISATRLKEKGNEYLRSNVPDSALLCYSMVISRYNQDMTDEQEKDVCASAYNNAAYVYFFFFNDYAQAYTYLLKGLEIAQATQNEGLISAIYLNIGNIYSQYNDDATALGYYKNPLKPQ